MAYCILSRHYILLNCREKHVIISNSDMKIEGQRIFKTLQNQVASVSDSCFSVDFRLIMCTCLYGEMV